MMLCIFAASHSFAAPSMEQQIVKKFLSTDPSFEINDANVVVPTTAKSRLKNCKSFTVSTGLISKRFDSTRVEISCSDGRKVTFFADVHGSIPVLVAKDRVRRGTPLSHANLTTENVNVQSLRKNFVSRNINFKKYTLRRNLDIGDVLYDRDLELIYDISFKSTVKARVNVNGVQIESDVIALSNAMNGELVEVENIRSKKRFMARVVSKNLVRVEK